MSDSFIDVFVAFGCPQSALFSSSKVIPTYTSTSGLEVPQRYKVTLTCPADHMLAKKYDYIENTCVISGREGDLLGEWTSTDTVRCSSEYKRLPKLSISKPETPGVGA